MTLPTGKKLPTAIQCAVCGYMLRVEPVVYDPTALARAMSA